MSKTTSPFIVAKKHKIAQQLKVSALSSMMLLAAGHAMAAEEAKKDAKKEEGKLSTVKVNADAINADFKADKVSSDKFTQPLVDTPQTIVVVKKELFQQQAATTLSETLRNTPGITLLMGENGNTATGDSIFMRGFDTQGSIFVDGIRDLGTISRDTFNTEQVEIAKGPAGVDNGRGAASGYVNLSSKLATLDDATSGNVTLGTGDYKRSSLDVNRALNDSTALRVNLVAQNAGVDGRDQVENNLTGIAGSLAMGLGSDTRTYVNLLHVQQRNLPDGGVSTAGQDGFYSAEYVKAFPTGGPAIEAPDSNNFYGSKGDHNDVDATMVTLRIEHDLANDLVLRNTSRFGRSTQDLELTGVSTLVFPAATKNDPTTWQVQRNRQGKEVTTQILTNQTNLTATFETGGLKHELASGAEFIYESQFTDQLVVPWASKTATTHLTQVNANLYNPSTGDAFQPLVKDGTKVDGETTTAALYVLDTITLNPQWEVSAGLRAERYYTKTDQIIRQGTATPQEYPIGTLLPREADAEDNLISWKLGGVFKPAENGSIYLSYATSQLPPGSSNFASQGAFSLSNEATSTNNAELEPQKGKNLELGTKWNIYKDRLALTAAVFQSSNENEVVINPDLTATQVGEREVTGIEFGAAGILMQNWQISAGLAVMDPEIKKGSSGSTATSLTSLDGGVIQWSPKVTFTLWNSYAFKNGLTIGGGARYVDSMKTSSITDPAKLATRSLVTVPDYWVFDAMASYAVSKNITLQLNVFNLADEEYLASVNSGGSRYFPGTPRSARLGVNFNF
jgi:catecholate siderophore receptor